jgi:plastocyanin
MHTLALQLAPLAGEKSKVPFYVAGGVLVAWALIVSLALGLRRPNFPGGAGGQRVVIAISAVLVLAALSTAVLTSGGSSTAGAAGSSAAQPAGSSAAAPNPAPPAPASTGSSGQTSAAPATTGAAPAPAPATTGAAPAPAKAATSLPLAANPGGQLLFDTKLLSAKAGTVTITLANSSPVEHNVTVAQGGAVSGATPTFVGGSRTLTLTLKAGTYTFYCSVPGHRQAGMEGTLKVA